MSNDIFSMAEDLVEDTLTAVYNTLDDAKTAVRDTLDNAKKTYIDPYVIYPIYAKIQGLWLDQEYAFVSAVRGHNYQLAKAHFDNGANPDSLYSILPREVVCILQGGSNELVEFVFNKIEFSHAVFGNPCHANAHGGTDCQYVTGVEYNNMPWSNIEAAFINDKNVNMLSEVFLSVAYKSNAETFKKAAAILSNHAEASPVLYKDDISKIVAELPSDRLKVVLGASKLIGLEKTPIYYESDIISSYCAKASEENIGIAAEHGFYWCSGEAITFVAE